MTKNLLDLSGKIDPATIEVYEAISNVAASLSIPFFVVGAAARDMILQQGFNVNTRRATVDVDLAVKVGDWKAYEKLKAGLVTTGDFKPSKSVQRLLYKDGLPIDIVPFGVERDNKISWPPDYDLRMSTLGFEEAYHYSQLVRLRSNPDLEILFASIPGLSIMKIISWSERNPSERNRDAIDLELLMRNYIEAGNSQRLYNEDSDLLNEDDFDYEKASARLLGRDIAKIVKPETKNVLLKILDRETGEQEQYRLIENMMRPAFLSAETFEEKLKLLEALKAGILD